MLIEESGNSAKAKDKTSTTNQKGRLISMQKALEMGKTSATGSFQLFIGVAASTIIMALGTIILTRLMTPEEYGLYSIALIPSYMAILFRDWGIDSAITRYVANLRARNMEQATHKIIAAGVIFEAVIGLTLSIIMIYASSFIASGIFQRPESSTLIAIVSATIFADGLVKASKAAFTGFERMSLNSITSICQAIVKTIATPLLVIAGYSSLGAVLGYTISYIVTGAASTAILYAALIKNIKKKNPHKLHLTNTLREMLKYGVPLSISNIITGFLQQFYAFLMAIYCTDAIIGNYQVATQFATILTFFTLPIATVLFPAFSKINPNEETELLQIVFASSVKYTALILVPATMAIMTISKPIVGTIFGDKWVQAPTYLALYVINFLFVVFGSFSMGSMLTGLGETKMLMKLNLITLLIGVPMAITLIPTWGIIGLITTTILAGQPSMMIGLYWIWRNYKTKADFKTSIKIFIASTLASATTLLAQTIINLTDWIELAIGASAFITAYLISTPLLGAVNTTDIQNLKAMFSGLGVISKLINAPLTAMEKISCAIKTT